MVVGMGSDGEKPPLAFHGTPCPTPGVRLISPG